MNNGQGTVTPVLGLYVPEGSDQADRIREALPELLDQLSINSIALDDEALDAALSARFEFPAHPS